MRTLSITLSAVAAFGLSSCGSDGGGVSTAEVQQAAVDRARQELGLTVDVPLKATVWTGREADGQLTYCGSVSGAGRSAASIRPQQFAAHGDPLTFFIFGDAHQVHPRSQPGKFENWAALCGRTQDA